VTDGISGEPVSGPLVHVERMDGKGVAYSNADSTGHYDVFDLYPGEFRVYTSQLDPLVGQVYVGHDYDETMSLAARNAFADTIVLAAGETVQGVDFVLNAGAHISGSVTSAINGAALNAAISLRRLDASGTGAYVYAAETKDSGSYSVDYASLALAPGTFQVSFVNGDFYVPQWYSLATSEAQATVVSLSAGENRTGIDALLTPTRTISGTIFDAGTLAPLAGRSVHAGYRTILLPSSENAITDVNGHYLLQGLGSGYGNTVWVEGSRGYQGAYYSTTPDGLETKVTLGINENATGIDIALPRGAYASGQVHDPKTGAGSANLTVRLYHPDGSTVNDIDREDQTASDSAGNYHTAAAPPGSYYLGVQIGQALFLYPGTLCNNPCDFTTGQPLDLSLAQEYAGLDISVAHLDDVFGDGFD
jgi:5-hydroxyisourate hydrolase-like protein (transthyretin family)